MLIKSTYLFSVLFVSLKCDFTITTLPNLPYELKLVQPSHYVSFVLKTFNSLLSYFLCSSSYLRQNSWHDLHIYLITPKIAKRRKKSRLIIYILRYHLENFIRSWTSSKDICNIFTISVTQCQNGIPQRNNIHDCVLFAYGYELFLDLKKIRFVNKYTVS